MTDLRIYREDERVFDLADAVRELDAVFAHMPWVQHELIPRTIFRAIARTQANSLEISIAVTCTNVGEIKVEIVAAPQIGCQARRIAVLVELKLQLNGALGYTLPTGKRELTIKIKLYTR